MFTYNTCSQVVQKTVQFAKNQEQGCNSLGDNSSTNRASGASSNRKKIASPKHQAESSLSTSAKQKQKQKQKQLLVQHHWEQ